MLNIEGGDGKAGGGMMYIYTGLHIFFRNSRGINEKTNRYTM